ncbi:hypothetical protein RYX36_026691 [Vicia faba]
MASKIISKKKNNKRSLAVIQLLPKDLLLEIVASIASQSFVNVHIMKICCIDFLSITEENYVLQNISLDSFSVIQRFSNEKALTFLSRCMESGNIEILFRDGFREDFGSSNENNIGGLERLKIAAQKGHKDALYVYVMILLCFKN